MVNDTISDILTRIRNANLIKSQTVSIPLTRMSKQISKILEKQGFIESFQTPTLNKISQEKNTIKTKLDTNLEPQIQLGEKTEKTVGIKKLASSSTKFSSNTKNLFSNKFEPKVNSSSEKIIIYLKYQGLDKKPCITNLKRISKPGLRIYASYKEIPKVLGGMGIAILSTSKGVMTDREARFHKIGGEILCSIW